MSDVLLPRLVAELPALGGWPEWAHECVLHNGAQKVMFYDEDGRFSHQPKFPQIEFEKESDVGISVSREAYEYALAASKPEWNGEGVPPVGCRVEANYGGEWVEATVAYTERPEGNSDAVAWKEALVFDCKTTRPFWADEFRPIRSEADKKRRSIISKIEKAYKDCQHINAIPEAIYEAIEEHIRID